MTSEFSWVPLSQYEPGKMHMVLGPEDVEYAIINHITSTFYGVVHMVSGTELSVTGSTFEEVERKFSDFIEMEARWLLQ